MVQRAVAVAYRRMGARCQTLVDILFRESDSGFQLFAQSQVRSDSRRECAPCAVSVGSVDLFGREQERGVARCEKYVVHLLLHKMSALDEDGSTTHSQEDFSCAIHVGLAVNGDSRQEGGLFGVGRDEGRPREEPRFQGIYKAVVAVETVAAGRYQYRVEHNVPGCIFVQHVNGRSDGLDREKHTYFHGIAGYIGKYGFELCFYDIRGYGLNAGHAAGVLCGHRCNDRHTIHAQC